MNSTFGDDENGEIVLETHTNQRGYNESYTRKVKFVGRPIVEGYQGFRGNASVYLKDDGRLVFYVVVSDSEKKYRVHASLEEARKMRRNGYPIYDPEVIALVAEKTGRGFWG